MIIDYNKQQFTYDIFTLNKNQRAVCDFVITCTYEQLTIVTPYHYIVHIILFFWRKNDLIRFPSNYHSFKT